LHFPLLPNTNYAQYPTSVQRTTLTFDLSGLGKPQKISGNQNSVAEEMDILSTCSDFRKRNPDLRNLQKPQDPSIDHFDFPVLHYEV
jgi:hypothetical protein